MSLSVSTKRSCSDFGSLVAMCTCIYRRNQRRTSAVPLKRTGKDCAAGLKRAVTSSRAVEPSRQEGRPNFECFGNAAEVHSTAYGRVQCACTALRGFLSVNLPKARSAIAYSPAGLSCADQQGHREPSTLLSSHEVVSEIERCGTRT